MKLSGAQRLGIVLSCLWIAAVGSRASYELYGPFPSCDHTLLTYLRNPEIPQRTGTTQFDPSTAVPVEEPNCPPRGMRRELRTGGAGGIAFIPPLAAWLLVAISVFAMRWVRAGFRNDKQESKPVV